MEVQCNIAHCSCPNGRTQNSENSLWNVVVCNLCNTQGAHVQCANLNVKPDSWKCIDCQQEANTNEKDKKNNSEKEKISPILSTVQSICKDPESAVKLPPKVKNKVKVAKRKPPKLLKLNDGSAASVQEVNLTPNASTSQQKTKVEKKTFKCDYSDCDAEFKNPSDLEAHQEIHIFENPYISGIDNLNGIDSYSIEGDDALLHKGDKPYKCDFPECDASFTCASHLKIHERTHTGEKPHKCDFKDCLASFAQSSTLKTHKRMHSGEKPYKCPFDNCPSAFMYSSSLKTHKLTHTGEKPYECGFYNCNAAFTCTSHLKIHQRIHTGEKPHKCDYDNCNAMFLRPSDLKTHKRKHSGERPYKCDYENCTSAFTYSSSLKTHQRLHTGEKPFKCDFGDCKSAFSYSSNLKTHQRIHTGEKPYKCEECDSAFTYLSSLNNHNKLMHPKVGELLQT